MKVIFGIGKVKTHSRKAVLAIGVFDGVHLGHQALLKKVVERAKDIRGEAIVLTFSPHPVEVLHPEKKLQLLVSLSYRLQLIERTGIDTCIVARFTQQFSQLSPRIFIERYLLPHTNLSDVFVGGDFRFGHDREGTLAFLKKEGRIFGFNVHGIDVIATAKKKCHSKISSSMIRRYIYEGKLKKASMLLGREVSFLGKVTRGQGLGTRLGFPTLNVHPQNFIHPPLGVYAAVVEIESKKYPGMAYIGRRPTIQGTNAGVVIEAHLFKFHKNVYGKDVLISFLKKIRGEKKFHSQEKLIEEMKIDKKRVLKYF